MSVCVCVCFQVMTVENSSVPSITERDRDIEGRGPREKRVEGEDRREKINRERKER